MNHDPFPIQGRILGRFSRSHQRLESEQRIAQAIIEAGEPFTSSMTVAARATAAGDTRRLRGIPAVSRNVAGVSPGTDPVAELLRKNR